MTAPCKDCRERHHGCHSECEKYLAFSKENEERRKAKAAETASTPEICRTVVKQIWKEMKGR